MPGLLFNYLNIKHFLEYSDSIAFFLLKCSKNCLISWRFVYFRVILILTLYVHRLYSCCPCSSVTLSSTERLQFDAITLLKVENKKLNHINFEYHNSRDLFLSASLILVWHGTN